MRLLLAARLSQTTRGQTGITSQDQDMADWADDQGHIIVATVATTRAAPLPCGTGPTSSRGSLNRVDGPVRRHRRGQARPAVTRGLLGRGSYPEVGRGQRQDPVHRGQEHEVATR